MTSDLLTLPGTDLRVSRLCLGGNRLGGVLDRDASFALLDAFVEQGGAFVDSAHIYANWLPDVERSCSEKTLGRWLKARGGAQDVVIATKIGHSPAGPGPGRLDEATLRSETGESLDHLGIPTIALLYLHRDDPARPVDEILGIMEAMRGEGLLRHYGASNWSAARLVEAEDIARRHGWAGFVANQPEWSLAERNLKGGGDPHGVDAAMFAFHRRTGMACMPYSSQAKGYFDKAVAGTLDEPTRQAFETPANREKAARLADIAGRHGATPTQVALNLLTRTPFPTIPVVGCRNAEQIASSFHALTLDLPDSEVADLLPFPARG